MKSKVRSLRQKGRDRQEKGCFLPISTASLQFKEVGSLPTRSVATTSCGVAAAICSIQGSSSPSHLFYRYLSTSFGDHSSVKAGRAGLVMVHFQM